MPTLKLRFRSDGDESRPPDFQMVLKKASDKTIKNLTPENRRRLNDHIKIFTQAFENYKKNIAHSLEQ